MTMKTQNNETVRLLSDNYEEIALEVLKKHVNNSMLGVRLYNVEGKVKVLSWEEDNLMIDDERFIGEFIHEPDDYDEAVFHNGGPIYLDSKNPEEAYKCECINNFLTSLVEGEEW